MTKPRKIAVGIGVAGACCAALVAATAGVARVAWVWTTFACAVAGAAYVWNRPEWLGMRGGRPSVRALPVLPYLVAFRIACGLMRRWRGADAPSRVAPGVWVAGRVTARELPPSVAVVVDLRAEHPADPAVRRLRGYRSLPVLDGGFPSDVGAFLALVEEIAGADGDVLVHCDSGRGRAPTMAAALLIARGDASGVHEALALVHAARPVSSPTRSDLGFLAGVLPALRAVAGRSRVPRRPAAGADPRTREATAAP